MMSPTPAISYIFFNPSYPAGGGHDSDYGHAMGFKDVGDIAVQHAVTGPFHASRIFPILFIYRHALELILKELIRDADGALVALDRCGSLNPAAQIRRTASSSPRPPSHASPE